MPWARWGANFRIHEHGPRGVPDCGDGAQSHLAPWATRADVGRHDRKHIARLTRAAGLGRCQPSARWGNDHVAGQERTTWAGPAASSTQRP